MIIGISGKAGSGKDSVAKAIQSEYETTVYIVSFATALKIEALKWGWDGKKDSNGRVLLQYIGWRERQDNPKHWIDKTFEVIRQRDGPDAVFVIPDVRFRNEADAIFEHGGVVWRVERPGYENGLTAVQKAHPSETEMNNYYLRTVIVNDGTLEQLHEKVEKAVDEEERKHAN